MIKNIWANCETGGGRKMTVRETACRRYVLYLLPELALVCVGVLVAFVAVGYHRTHRSPYMMFGEIDLASSTWDLVWMGGIPLQDRPREWWFGIGHTWRMMMREPILCYAVGRGIGFVILAHRWRRRLTKKVGSG